MVISDLKTDNSNSYNSIKLNAITILAIFILTNCKQTSYSKATVKNELIEYINSQKNFVSVKSDSLPQHIKSYQTLVLEFLRSNKFRPEEYYARTDIRTWTEDDEIYSDTSATYLSVNLYHLNYFKVMLQAKKDFLKDSVVTYAKGNVGGKNFSVSINKEKNKVFGPYYWK